MLERLLRAGVPVALLLALSACTVPPGEPAETSESSSAAVARGGSGRELPGDVPFTAGTADLVESAVFGEFSRYPQGRWVVQVTASRVHSAAATLEIVERELADAGYRPVSDADAGHWPVPELLMRRNGTTVHVQLSRELPWLIDYTVVRSFAECARSLCD